MESFWQLTLHILPLQKHIADTRDCSNFQKYHECIQNCPVLCLRSDHNAPIVLLTYTILKAVLWSMQVLIQHKDMSVFIPAELLFTPVHIKSLCITEFHYQLESLLVSNPGKVCLCKSLCSFCTLQTKGRTNLSRNCSLHNEVQSRQAGTDPVPANTFSPRVSTC